MLSSPIENRQMWNNDVTYDQYEILRLDRIKEQRQRMENMRDLVQKYIHIISELQYKNSVLSAENNQLKMPTFPAHESTQSSYNTLHDKYIQVCQQLSIQRKRRQKCEQTINALRNQLTSTGLCSQATRQPYIRNINYEHNNNVVNDYEILVGLYSDLQDQIYTYQKENMELKEVIREQSRLCYEKDNFWKLNQRKDVLFENDRAKGQVSNKQNKPGLIKISSKHSIKPPTTQPTQTKTTQPPKQNSPSQPPTQPPTQPPSSQPPSSSKKHLLTQLKKQEQLLKKYKHNEQQQNTLIQILKSQKTKVCKCHASSKNIITSSKKTNAFVSFNDKTDFTKQD